VRVNIIYEPGWVLEDFAKQLQRRLSYVVLQEYPQHHKINYFMPYYLLKKGPWKSIGWFTHQEEEREDLKAKFKWAAMNADYCISHSYKYAHLIESWGIKKVIQILPGISHNKFKPKVRLGFVGRLYSSTNRKNPQLLEQVKKLGYVELKATNGKLKAKDLPDFYRSLDAVFVASTVEGGPMCIQEGLACGIPVIAPSGVGVVDEFSGAAIIKYKKGDFSSARKAIKTIYERKTRLSKTVSGQTWDEFAKRHDRIFRMFEK